MKKIAIISIYDENNYGNRLQNYAVQKTLEKLGVSAETIVALKEDNSKKSIKFYIAMILCKISIRLVAKMKLQLARLTNFKKFTKKNIRTRYIVSEDGNFSTEVGNEYDYFVVGSDQVWNPTFNAFAHRYKDRFLEFTSPEKRVCFAPSIGVSAVPSKFEEVFITGLSGFNELSIREKSGAEIIKKLTGRDAEVLIDPTLMLNADEWLKASKKVKLKKEPYVLEYFLGQRDDEKLSKLAKENNLSRITLLDKNNPKVYMTNPGEFIYMISKADLICTDSFHACVFSIIFNKPFIIYKRKDKIEDMYSRIDNLLEMFNVSAEETPLLVPQQIRDDVLKIEREKVINFLKRNFENES